MTDIKERPILMSAEMVRATLDDRKSVTRRVIKLPRWATGWDDFEIGSNGEPLVICRDTGCLAEVPCPYGIPGHRLYVRESWCAADLFYGRDLETPAVIAYLADRTAINFDSDPPRPVGRIDIASWNWSLVKGRPSIHMPRWASRINLEITEIRVERLTSITAADVVAEGVRYPVTKDRRPLIDMGSKYAPIIYLPDRPADHPNEFPSWTHEELLIAHFAYLWDSINGKRPGCSWADNCYVWVVSFRRIA